jgi:hypothetical protein
MRVPSIPASTTFAGRSAPPGSRRPTSVLGPEERIEVDLNHLMRQPLGEPCVAELWQAGELDRPRLSIVADEELVIGTSARFWIGAQRVTCGRSESPCAGCRGTCWLRAATWRRVAGALGDVPTALHRAPVAQRPWSLSHSFKPAASGRA